MRPTTLRTCLAILATASASTPPAAGATGGQSGMRALPDYIPGEDISIARAAPPAYPPEALLACAHGISRIQVSVDATGRVVDAKLLGSSGNGYLDVAAIQATRDWRFNPKVVNGKPEGGDAVVPVNFADPCPMELALDDPRTPTLVPPAGWDAAASREGWAPYEDVSGRKRHPPEYPEPALRACAGGVVQLRVTVTANGKARTIVVETSSGNADIDNAALQAAQDWSYKPGKRGERAVGGDVIVPVHFKSPC